MLAQFLVMVKKVGRDIGGYIHYLMDISKIIDWIVFYYMLMWKDFDKNLLVSVDDLSPKSHLALAKCKMTKGEGKKRTEQLILCVIFVSLSWSPRQLVSCNV